MSQDLENNSQPKGKLLEGFRNKKTGKFVEGVLLRRDERLRGCMWKLKLQTKEADYYFVSKKQFDKQWQNAQHWQREQEIIYEVSQKIYSEGK